MSSINDDLMSGGVLQAALVETDASGNTVLLGPDGFPFISSMSRWNVQSYGAKCDGLAVYDAVYTSASNIVTSASAPFKTSDVGKMICVGPHTEARNYWQISTIAQYDSPTQIRMTNNATSSASSATCVFGTDDKVALDAALAWASSHNGGAIYIPGICTVSGKYVVPNNVTLEGNSVTRPAFGLQHMTYKGSCLLRLAAVSGGPFITLGVSATYDQGAHINGLTVDGLDMGSSVLMAGHGCEVIESAVFGGGYGNVLTMGPSGTLYGSYIIGDITEATSGVISVVGDCKVKGNQIYGIASTYPVVKITGGGSLVNSNHIYAGRSVYTAASTGGILIEQGAGSSGSNIVSDNMLDCPYGPAIHVSQPSATSVIAGLSITGNTTYSNSVVPSDVTSLIKFTSTAGAKLKAAAFVGNSARPDWNSESSSTLKHLIDVSAASGDFLGVVVTGNVGNGGTNTTSQVYSSTSVPSGIISANNALVRVDGTVLSA